MTCRLRLGVWVNTEKLVTRQLVINRSIRLSFGIFIAPCVHLSTVIEIVARSKCIYVDVTFEEDCMGLSLFKIYSIYLFITYNLCRCCIHVYSSASQILPLNSSPLSCSILVSPSINMTVSASPSIATLSSSARSCSSSALSMALRTL